MATSWECKTDPHESFNWLRNELVHDLCRYSKSCCSMQTGRWMLARGCGCRVRHSPNRYSITSVPSNSDAKSIPTETSSSKTQIRQISAAETETKMIYARLFLLVDRKYLPVLKNFALEYIHEPWKAPEEAQRTAKCIIGKDYPLPMVRSCICLKDLYSFQLTCIILIPRLITRQYQTSTSNGCNKSTSDSPMNR